MEIVELHKENLPEYKAFILRALSEHPENFRISVEDERYANFPTRSEPDSFTLAARNEENQLMGIVSFQRDGENRSKIRHKGLLFRMYVAEEFSGMGIGKALIEELLSRVRKLDNMEQVNLSLVTTNIRARHLYTRFGFETFGVERKAHKSGKNYYDEEFMVLYLKKT